MTDPKIIVPPAPAKHTGPPSTTAALAAMAKKYPTVGTWIKSGLIENAALAWGMNPVEVAAVLVREGGQATTQANSRGAVGPAQIVDTTVRRDLNPTGYQAFAAQYAPDGKITAAMKADPVFAINYLAWRMAGSRADYPSLDAWYASPGYNPGYTGPGPSTLIKGAGVGTYQVNLPQTPTQKAGTTVTATNARAGVVSPWAVLTNHGTVKFVSATSPPKGTITDAAGNPYTQQNYSTVARSLDTLYLAYSGVRASAKSVANYLKAPVSDYEITQRLSNPDLNPRFYKSPVWTTHAPEYESVYKSIFGNDAKPDKAALTYGVVHSLTQTAFQQYLRDQPGYEKTEEFKANAAQFRSGYQAIYGNPDPAGEGKIAEAVKKGWNGDQWTQYLRAQPEYTASGEFQRNVYSLFTRMGLVQGAPGASSAPQTGLAAAGPMAATPALSPTATGSASG